jgi:PAS domain S-box-containing protein
MLTGGRQNMKTNHAAGERHAGERAQDTASRTTGRSTRSLHRAAIWFAAGVIVISGALTAMTLAYLRSQAIERGTQQSLSFTQLVAEQTTRMIQSVDHRLELVSVELRQLAQAGRLTEDSARQLLRKEIRSLPYVRATWTLDTQGRIEFDSDEGNMGISLADRDYFQAYVKNPRTGFYLGDPVVSRSVGTWLISAARPMHDANGKFSGVLVAAIVPSYFEKIWGVLTKEEGSSIALMRRSDGVLLMRSPANDAFVGKSSAHLPMFTQLLPAAPNGSLTTESAIDNVTRFFYQTLSTEPQLVILAGQSRQVLLAPWRRVATVAGLTWAGSSLSLALLCAYLLRVSRLRIRAEDRADEVERHHAFGSRTAGIVEWKWNTREPFWRMSANHYSTLGYPAGDEKVSHVAWRSLVHPDDIASSQEAYELLLTGDEDDIDIEIRLRRADDKYQWVHLFGHVAQHDRDGRPAQVAGIRIDVTRRKQAEIERQQVFDRITDAFVALDLDWHYTFVNARAGELFGREPDSLIGKHIWTEFPEGRGQKFHLLYEQAMATQKYISAEEYYPPYQRWFENHIYPSPDGLSIYFQEITERKTSELALRASEEKLRQLTENMHGVFWLMDAQTRKIEYVSPNYEHVFGLSCASLLADVQSWRAVMYPPDMDVVEQAIATQDANGGYDTEYRIVRADGSLRWIHERSKAVRDASGTSVRYSGMAEDVTERHEGELALQTSAAKYRSLVETSPFAILVHVDGQVVMANPSAVQLFGASQASELMGMAISELIHPDDRKPSEDRRHCLERGDAVVYPVQMRCLRLDGRIFHVDTTVSRVDFDGRQAIQSLAIDVSERVQAQAALSESETKYRELVDKAPHAIIVHVDDIVVMVNRSAVRVFGAGHASELVGLHIDTLTEPSYRVSSGDRWHQALQGIADLFPVEIQGLRLDGNAFEMQVTASVMPYEGSTAMVAQVVDISDRLRAEEALHKSEEQFRLAFNASAIGLGMTHPDGRWLQVNQALCEIVGYSEQHLLSINFQSITHPDDLERDLEQLERLLDGHVGHYQMEKRYIHAQGHVVWIHLTVSLVRDAGGAPLYTIAQIEDVSERRRLETELLSSQARLTATFNAMPDLLFEVGADGTIYDFHSPHTDLLLFAPGEFLGKRVSETMPRQAADVVHHALREAARTGRSIGHQYTLDLPGGERWFELSVSRKASLAQEGQRFITLARDVTERVQSEVDLRHSEERFRQMAENIKEVFWLANAPDGAMLYISPAFETMTGITVASVMKDSNAWVAALHPDDRANALAAVQAGWGADGYDLEYRLLTLAGAVRWIHSRAFPVRDALGISFRMAGIMDDVTARKNRQQQEDIERGILESLASDQTLPELLAYFVRAYEALLPPSRGSALLMDPDGVHLRHGAAPQLPKTYCDAIDDIAIGPDTGSCGTAAYTGEAVMVADIQCDPRWRDHREIAARHGLRACWSVPIKSTGGKLLGTFAFYFNAPRVASADELELLERGAQLASAAIERRQAVDALQKSESRYRALVEWSPLGIAVHQAGSLVYVNPACMEIFGARSAAELIGKQVLDLVVEAERPQAQARTDQVLAGETTPLALRRFLRLNGSVVEIESKGAPISINSAPAVQFTMRDVTAENTAKRALQNNRTELRKLSARVLAVQETERRRIAHELHDELGQALTAVKINLQAHSRFGKQAIDPLEIENIRIVEGALQHVRHLSLALRPSMLDDLGLVPALRWLSDQAATRSGLIVRLESAIPLSRLDPDLETACFRVVQEALTNVARHAGASEVRIGLAIDKDMLQLSVRDDGCGFDVKQMRQRATRGGSMGILGMQERASLLEGSLEIESRPGQGSELILRCPWRLRQADA